MSDKVKIDISVRHQSKKHKYYDVYTSHHSSSLPTNLDHHKKVIKTDYGLSLRDQVHTSVYKIHALETSSVYAHYRDQNLLAVQCIYLYVYIVTILLPKSAGPRSAVGRAPDPEVRRPGFDTRSGHILSFLPPLIQEGQLSVTGESMCTKYWLTA